MSRGLQKAKQHCSHMYPLSDSTKPTQTEYKSWTNSWPTLNRRARSYLNDRRATNSTSPYTTRRSTAERGSTRESRRLQYRDTRPDQASLRGRHRPTYPWTRREPAPRTARQATLPSSILCSLLFREPGRAAGHRSRGNHKMDSCHVRCHL